MTVPRGTSCGWSVLLALLVFVAACRSKPGTRRVTPPQSSSALAASATRRAPRAPIGTSRLAILELFYARPYASHELAECANAELRACLAPYIKPSLAPWDIQGLVDNHCFRGARATAMQAGDCLPLRAGTDVRNGKELLFDFICSDICPDQGGVSLLYKNVDEAECCKLGAQPGRIWPGVYAGCGPAERAAATGGYLVTPDGKWHQVQSSFCPNSPLIIVAEWPCEPPVGTRRELRNSPRPLPLAAVYAPNAQIFTEASCTSRFDAAIAERALSRFDARARKCLTSLRSGKVALRIKLLGNGTVADVSLTEPNWQQYDQQRYDQVRCIQGVFGTAMIEPFREERGELIHRL